MKSRFWTMLTVLTLVAVLGAACGPSATPTPVPPTAVPATAVPPTKPPAAATAVPVAPTAVPPTAVPPTKPPAVPTPWGGGKFGGTFKAAFVAIIPSLDLMATSSAMTMYTTQYTFDPLVALDETYKPAPGLALKWDVSADGLTYTFYLRQGVKFHNGKEMTSEDAVASVIRFIDVNSRKGSFSAYKSVAAKDKYTFTMTLSAPVGGFIDILAFPAAQLVIIPKEIIEGKKANDLKLTDMIGTGPYKMVDAKLDQYVKLARFEGYVPWLEAPSGIAGTRVPYFDTLELYIVPEAGARVAGIETGAYDWVEAVPAGEYDRLKANKAISPYVASPLDWEIVLMFNHADKWSGNVKFRQAVLAALDMDAIGMAVTGGKKEFYRLNPSLWVPEGAWYVEDANSKALYNQKNPEKAKALLKEIGYNGEEIIFQTNRSYDWMYKTIVAVADQLKKNVGMNTRVDVVDWTAQQAAWDSKTGWHISETGWRSQAIFAPDALVSYFHSNTKGGLNTFFNNPAWDKAVVASQAAPTYEARKAEYTKIQSLFYELLPQIKVIDTFGVEALRANIKGFKPWYRASRFWNLWRE